ncbi:MAG: hypothetical protein K2J20_06860 [Bacilli bacterium]|nr:hypothetical protein [Bacilli bacterium]
MANLAAPYSEAYTSYKSYSTNNLLNLPLEFTIPVFENMPENTVLPGTTANTTCQSEIKDTKFEALLDAEKFPESYKCKLRALHAEFPEWAFKALITNLDFNTAVKREQRVSSIQGTTYYQKTTATECKNGFGGTAKNGYCQTEKGWYIANTDTVAFYLDPRNFLVKERILMFEHLAYSDKYSEKVVASILKGTFMEGLSVLDNMTYSQIFYEAGKTANISAVYLASLAIQESGTKVSNTTNGSTFTYDGVTYKGLYNFFNIGASSSASNPALAGLVWANGGSENTIVNPNDPNVQPPSSTSTPENPTNPSEKPSDNKPEEKPTSTLTEEKILASLAATKKNNCLTSLALGTKVSTLKSKLKDLTVTIDNAKDTDIIKTGQVITITDGIKKFTYTIVVSGDVDGDGKIGAADYVKIKNYIMEKKNSDLNLAQSLAADVDGNGKIGAPDYVRIKNSIMKG